MDKPASRGPEDVLPTRIFAAVLLLVGACTLTACAPPSLRELTQGAGGMLGAAAAVVNPSQTEPAEPLLVFLAEAEEGEVRDLDDAVTGARLRVTAGRTYHAASGRICRRFSATAPEGKEEGLACRDASGLWIRAGLLAPDSP